MPPTFLVIGVLTVVCAVELWVARHPANRKQRGRAVAGGVKKGPRGSYLELRAQGAEGETR